MKTTKIKLLTAASLLTLGVTNSQAALVAGTVNVVTEEFDVPPYVGTSAPSTGSPVASRLAGQAGAGTGLSGNWVTGGNQIIVDSDTGLSATGRDSSGGHVRSTFTSSLASTISLSAAAQASISTTSELWISYLIRGTSAGGTHNFKLNTAGAGSANMFVGQRLAGYHVGLTSNPFTGTGFAANTTYLIVGRLTIDRAAGMDETLDLWSTTNATTFDKNATPVLTTTGNLLDGAGSTFDSLTLAKNTNGFDFDSIQVDVVPVPEPSSTALLGLGGLALILRRRRK